MGTWYGPTIQQTLYFLLDDIDPHAKLPRTEIIEALTNSGAIVPKGFYIPDVDELYGLMRKWSFHLPRGMEGARWVMCRETVDALVKRELDKLTPDLLVEIGSSVMKVVEFDRAASGQHMLFGIPIRIDSAARSPLFEINTPATMTGSTS